LFVEEIILSTCTNVFLLYAANLLVIRLDSELQTAHYRILWWWWCRHSITKRPSQSK